MPATDPHDARQGEGAIRATVIRLARPQRNGDAVIERSAIMAEGTPAAAIEAWIVAHGGEPETARPAPRGLGLYGDAHSGRATAVVDRAPRRYVLPASAFVV